ncbi:hypothetical protein [Methylobacterium nonmethylotrophicum]|uniref:Uncharacterized protein n=1 Tax=Methylobacterium nonmethylotrophicum TaxID=1141884 RepID=A0A4Z0NFI2_9HYPH|nr:hypothetical protein [Methylobacterium nonmethylotrophicum]TGD93713.1 hypothetical protein EU555_33025 [Methylobacterium nonmethylotrophicum]
MTSNTDPHSSDALDDRELDQVTGGADNQIHMLQLQQALSQRQMLVQMTSNIMSSMNKTTQTIIGNIR